MVNQGHRASLEVVVRSSRVYEFLGSKISNVPDPAGQRLG